jgi:squalene synthase HpnC
MADEGRDPAIMRQERLCAWQRRLHAAAAGAGELSAPATRDDLIFRAVGYSIRTLNLPVSLFDDLLSAFGQDIMTTRYASWSDVLDYCRRSANPVGRLVLRIAGYDVPALDRSADALCTALQLTNFWQDFGRDWRAGRLYVPLDLCRAAGALEGDLHDAARRDGVLPAPWVDALTRCTAFTRDRFDEGRAVCDGVRGRLRIDLRATWVGGRRILERVESGRHHLLRVRPVLGAADAPLLAWRTLTWRARHEVPA